MVNFIKLFLLTPSFFFYFFLFLFLFLFFPFLLFFLFSSSSFFPFFFFLLCCCLQEKRDAELRELAGAELEAFELARAARLAEQQAAQMRREQLRQSALTWPDADQALLDAAVQACRFDAFESGDALWAHIALSVPGRSGAECRAR
jgi:hypothetical protein